MWLSFLCILFLSLTVLTSAFSKTVNIKKRNFLSSSVVKRVKEHFELLQVDTAMTGTEEVIAQKNSSKTNAKSSFQQLIALLVPQIGKAELPKTSPPHRLSIHQLIYLILTSIFVTCLIVADMIGVKIFEFKLPFSILGHNSVEHTCGMITFPITFLLGDIINEYYGPKATRHTVYIGLAMSILVFFVMNIAQALPYLDKPFNGKLILVLTLAFVFALLIIYS